MRARRAGMSVHGRDRLYGGSRAVRLAGRDERGQVLATGTPAESDAAREQGTLEDAFIAALPGRYSGPDASVRTFRHVRSSMTEPAIVARDSPAGSAISLRSTESTSTSGAGDLRISRLQRMRQDHDDEDADRPVAGERGRGDTAGQAGRGGRHEARTASATCRSRSRSTRNSRSRQPRSARASVPSCTGQGQASSGMSSSGASG